MAHMLGSKVIKTHFELDFFSPLNPLQTEEGIGLKFKDAQTLKSVVMRGCVMFTLWY